MNDSHGYRKLRMIGSGLSSKVYLVRKNNKNFALKTIKFHDLEEKKKIQNEIDTLSSLDDKRIVKYYESFVDNGFYNIVMEYCNKNLREFIKDCKKYKEIFLGDKENIIKINTIIFEICLGIKTIHENNIIHRNLKPENIFIDEDFSIKIGDFGISKELKFNEKNAKTSVRTYNYMAPEILKGEKFNDKVDIWAFGCIIYELLTSKFCFKDKSISGLIDKIINQNHKTIKISNKKHRKEYEKKYEKEYEKYQKLIDILLKKDDKERMDIFTLYEYLIGKVITITDKIQLRFEILVGNSLFEYLNYLKSQDLNEIKELELKKRNVLDISKIENVNLKKFEKLNLKVNKISDIKV